MPYANPADARAWRKANRKGSMRASMLKYAATPKGKATLKRVAAKKYQKNKTKLRARQVERQDVINAGARARRNADLEGARVKERAAYSRTDPRRKKSWALQKRYGITIEDQDAMILAQGGCCPVCGEPLDLDRTRSLHTDHDHETGAVRGITHAACNTALGRLGDNVAGLSRALRYVSGTSAFVDGASAGLLF